MELDVSAVILAGGQSRRLGKDKTALRIGGQTLLARTVDLMGSFCREVIIVTSTSQTHAHAGARVVSDIFAGKGVLGAIYSGLAVSCSQRIVVVGADMPFLSRPLLTHLVCVAADYAVVAPVLAGQVEPLHAVYGDACLPAMRRQLLGAAAPRIISFFPDVRVLEVEENDLRAIDPQLLSFFNINTPADLERAQGILRRQGLDVE